MTRKEELRKQVDYESDPHTRLKHAFYRRYIACWMGKVLQGRWAKPATIIDGFAGSGMYSDGLDGSAMMIAKLFREHICRPNFQPLTHVTNDLDPRRTEALEGRMMALPADDRISHVSLGPTKFEDAVGEVRQKHAPPGKQTLWIIDPECVLNRSDHSLRVDDTPKDGSFCRRHRCRAARTSSQSREFCTKSACAQHFYQYRHSRSGCRYRTQSS